MRESETGEATATRRALAPRRSDSGTSIFAFDGTDRARWFELNDDVMGGISTSRVSLTDDDTLLFEGQRARTGTAARMGYDSTLLVWVPTDVQVERTMSRDACTREEAQARIDERW